MKLSDIKLNSTAIETGRWVDAPGLGGVQFKVRGLGNADYRRLSAKLNDQVPRGKRIGGRVEPAEADRIVTTLLLDTILIDWKGLTDEADAPMPYTREQGETLLADPDYRVLRESLIAAASIVGEETGEDLETAGKN